MYMIYNSQKTIAVICHTVVDKICIFIITEGFYLSVFELYAEMSIVGCQCIITLNYIIRCHMINMYYHNLYGLMCKG